MVTFDVVDRFGDKNDIMPQACIFKVGDDCRQDVLALQVIALLRDIFDAVGINLYLYPYGVLPTGPGRGIIEVVPNSRSRSQMGETTDGGLYEIFQQDFGAVGSPSFEAARENFIISSAGYAVASLLLQPKDRHNGNLLFDNGLKTDGPTYEDGTHTDGRQVARVDHQGQLLRSFAARETPTHQILPLQSLQTMSPDCHMLPADCVT